MCRHIKKREGNMEHMEKYNIYIFPVWLKFPARGVIKQTNTHTNTHLLMMFYNFHENK